MSKIKIDKNVKMPTLHRSVDYPFAEMRVGDSFFTTDNRIRVVQATQYRQRTLGTKYAVRAVEGGFRVWRTK